MAVGAALSGCGVATRPWSGTTSGTGRAAVARAGPWPGVAALAWAGEPGGRGSVDAAGLEALAEELPLELPR